MLASANNIPFVSGTPPSPPSKVSSSKNFLGLIFRPDLLTSSCLGGDCVGELGVFEFADAPTTEATDGSDDFTDDSLVLEADFRDDCTDPRFARFDSVSF
jgi:hypothetical protein